MSDTTNPIIQDFTTLPIPKVIRSFQYLLNMAMNKSNSVNLYLMQNSQKLTTGLIGIILVTEAQYIILYNYTAPNLKLIQHNCSYTLFTFRSRKCFLM